MRRLPVFFLIDVSESMVGEPIAHVEEGLRTMIQSLKQDPYSLETIWLSVIAFAGKAKTLVPLTDLISYYPPQLPIGAGTSLGAGLQHLMLEIDRNVLKTTAEVKGDWKPIVFLFTDGVPTDTPQQIIQHWNERFRNRCTTVAISFGNNADSTLLRQFANNVMGFNDANPAAYKEFFRWVTASIRSSSQSVSQGIDGLNIEKVDPDIVKEITNGMHKSPAVDVNHAVFLGKCQNTQAPYLLKYRLSNPEEIGRHLGGRPLYRLTGAHPVTKEYFDLSEGRAVSGLRLSTDQLMGFPACPCCGNSFAFATCACGGILCLDGPGKAVCPWCGETGNYGRGEGSIDVQRTKG